MTNVKLIELLTIVYSVVIVGWNFNLKYNVISEYLQINFLFYFEVFY